MDHVNLPPVSQHDVERYQNNERVKYCLKKYVCDEIKVAAQSEKAIEKA